MQGKIIKNISNQYTVLVNKDEYVCTPRGKFRNDKLTPLVGDEVVIDPENNYILEILPRLNELVRPMIANVDYAVVITSCKNPNLSLNLLDKLLSVITYNNITPIICFTKLDLLSSHEYKEVKKLAKYYESIGIKTFYNNQLFKARRLLKNKIIVLCGQTGAGKSSFLNKLDKKLNLKTQEISLSLGRGKHTTRHVELFHIGNFLIADTPGFSALELKDMNLEDLQNSFVEFGKSCEYGNCKHVGESNCSVKDRVDSGKIIQSRYDNYVKFIDEIKK